MGLLARAHVWLGTAIGERFLGKRWGLGIFRYLENE